MILLALAALLQGQPADEAAVREAENRWSQAFMGGDAAYLDTLLAPEYVSVGAGGQPHPKGAVVAMATQYAAEHPGAQATPMGPTSTIAVTGDLALVRHSGEADVSVDVFQKRGGRWMAVYSQHTAKPKAG